MTEVPVVLGIARSDEPSDKQARPKAGISLAGDTPDEQIPALGPATSLVPILAEAAEGIGAISIGTRTGLTISRTVPLVWTSENGLIPSLSLEILRIYLGDDSIILWEAEHVPGTAGHLTLAGYRIPLTLDGQLWLHARHEDTGHYISAQRVLSGEALPQLDGAIVLVGTSAAGLHDLRTTPLLQTVPGVAIHAQAIEQILSGQHLVRSDTAEGVELLLFLSAGLIVAATMSIAGPVIAVATGGTSAIAIALASWIGFSGDGFLLDATFPLFGTFLLFSILTLYRLFVTDRDARRIRRSFSHYVAPDVLRVIESGGHKVELGGSNQPVTVMFSDIRNFTQLSETLNAEGVVALLNRLFAELSDQIIANHGTIDKFMGDSVMAFWNAPVPAPDHAARACRAALAMRKALEAHNAASDTPCIRMGLGLATGTACVGNIGSRQRFNYTAIGEAVNVAARLEAACRDVECDILASSAVREAAPDFAWLPAGRLGAKGLSGRVEAYVLVGDPTLKESKAFVDLARAHEDLTAAFSSGGGAKDGALPTASKLAGSFEGLHAFYERLPSRLDDYTQNDDAQH